MTLKWPRISSIVLLALLQPATSWSASANSPAIRLDQTWFGTFTNILPDGKVSHDQTVLILNGEGNNLSGSVGPAIDRLSPIIAATTHGNTVSFRIEGGGGIVFTLRLNQGHLVGMAKSSRINAVLDLTPAPGVMPQAQLVSEITTADKQAFAAYEACDADEYKKSMSPDLEFYQDNQPTKDRLGVLKSLSFRCAEGIKLRRELDTSSLIINAAPPNEAIEAGLHRIYSGQPDGTEHLDATVRFTMIWSKKSGAWQLVRVISYDHR